MNLLGINCSVQNKRGRLVIAILKSDGCLFHHIFRSPSVFSFLDDTGEILNWHKDNIISLISLYDIEGIVVKKTERISFRNQPADSAIFKLYMEGVMLSLAGTHGVYNKHYYKNNIVHILNDPDAFENDIESLISKYGKTNHIDTYKSTEQIAIKEALLAVIALDKEINND